MASRGAYHIARLRVIAELLNIREQNTPEGQQLRRKGCVWNVLFRLEWRHSDKLRVVRLIGAGVGHVTIYSQKTAEPKPLLFVSTSLWTWQFETLLPLSEGDVAHRQHS